jgi:hypothetical protein
MALYDAINYPPNLARHALTGSGLGPLAGPLGVNNSLDGAEI